MATLLRLTLAALLAGAAGCYEPTPAAGSYFCAADRACPSNLHCTCGLCVAHDDQAACGFTISAAVAADGVDEHEPFAVHLQALAADGKSSAAGFDGIVALSASWGDVRVVGRSDGSVAFVNGQADAQVALNRETLPPQTATLAARFGSGAGTSNPIGVHAPVMTRDADPTVAVPTLGAPFGFANMAVAQPDVRHATDGWHLYFAGLSGQGFALGAASSADGVHFTGATTPLLAQGGAAFDSKIVSSPAVFPVGNGLNLAFGGSDTAFNTIGTIGIASSSDGTSPFQLGNGGQPILTADDCGYCDRGVDYPQVIADPTAPLGDGGSAGGWLLFFSASAGADGVNIGRARAGSDGLHFVPEPAALLTGEVGGEAVLLSPRVLVDGTVWKMWYTYAGLTDAKGADLCSSKLNVGYATSSDGLYWIRSPSNPQLPMGGGGWDTDITAFLVGSVVPSDGSDAANGLSVYYSTMRATTVLGTSVCLPNGIGRATRR